MNLSTEYSWYKLINIKGLGPKSLLKIYNVLARTSITLDDVFQFNEQEFYSVFRDFGKGKYSRVKHENFHNLNEEKIYNSYEELIEKNINIIPIQDERYPKSIKKRLKIDSPPILYCKGALSLLNSSSISIVGSRSADENTLLLTKKLSSKLAKEEYNIVSGYAKGVDTNAHLGALEIEGTTSVVLPLGIKNLSIKRDFRKYNWENNTLFISQFLPYAKWRASNAMARNKIVTSLSKAIIVITSGPERDERGRMSGTFEAGKTALELGVPVFVLSPSVLKGAPKGNIELIKKGAIEIKNADDVLENLYKIDTNSFSQNVPNKQLILKV